METTLVWINLQPCQDLPLEVEFVARLESLNVESNELDRGFWHLIVANV